jgi:hypothetical protein
MKGLLALLAAALLALSTPAQAEARAFSQAELDALLAPVALYPDSVLSHILVAATRPHDLQEAAAWSRANSHLTPEHALAAAEPMPWHPSVKALLAFPDLLARMDESPQWTADLGHAFLEQEPYVMDTVQALRRRAQASGALQSTDQYRVYEDGPSIAVYSVHPQVVYLPYYNPYVVYGTWWWPAYRPVHWRPWHPRPVHVSKHFFAHKVDWHRRHVVRSPSHWQVKRPSAPVTIHNHAHPARPIIQGARVHAPRPAPRPGFERREHRSSTGGLLQNKQHHLAKQHHGARPMVHAVPHAVQRLHSESRSSGPRFHPEPRGSGQRHWGGNGGRGKQQHHR